MAETKPQTQQLQKKQNNPFVCDSTYQKLSTQKSIIKKIIKQLLKSNKNKFPQLLVYQISRFLFRNPLSMKIMLYAPTCNQLLSLNLQYLCRKSYLSSLQNDINKIELANQSRSLEMQKNHSQQSAFITVTRSWKSMIINESDYNQVLQKGKLFLIFLSKVTFFNGTQNQNERIIDPLKDYHQYQKRQKQNNNKYYIVSENIPLTLSYLSEIYKYEKDKKMNAIIIKSFVNLMAKNMVLLKIQSNYDTKPTGSEGKYLYIENKLKLPIKSTKEKCNETSYISIEFSEKHEWEIVNQTKDSKFTLFKQVNFPINRKKNHFITKKLKTVEQTDVWIEIKDHYFQNK